jgi:membrane associated rhomboid family serine protease
MAYPGSRMQNPFGFSITPWVKKLLIANGVVFLLTWAIGLHVVVAYFAFTPARILAQPWTPLTYMFVHAGFFHLFFNMLVLFFFGPPLEERWGSREFIKFYLIAGFGGAALSFAFPQTPIVGASGAVYGVMMAYALYWPDNPIYIWGILPVKAKYLVGFLFVISLVSAADTGSGVAHMAHLGGFVAAFAYLRSPWGPSQWGARRAGSTASGPARDLLGAFRRGEKERSVAPARRPAPVRRTTRGEDELLDEVDRILDKISQEGIGALTDEERQRLDEASRRDRSN